MSSKKKSILKVLKLWRKIPTDYRNKIKYLVHPIINFLNSVLGNQNKGDAVGQVKRLPFLQRPMLKRSFAQQGEDLILDRIIYRIMNWDLDDPKTYVDIGAYHPVDHSLSYLLYLRGWNGLAIDASYKSKKLFQKYRPRDKFSCNVVGLEDGIEVSFFTPSEKDGLALGSTKFPDKNKIYSETRHFQINITNELRRQGIDKIHFLNVDIEDAEMELLNTLDFTRHSPSVIAIEIHGNDIEKNLKSEIALFLKDKGYICVASAVITYFFVKKSEVNTR
jgi:hypothetical protein